MANRAVKIEIKTLPTSKLLCQKQTGMSLIEVSLVLLLVALLLGFALPRFGALFESPVRRDGVAIRDMILRLKKEALLGGVGFKVVLDQPLAQVRVYQQDAEDPELYHEYQHSKLALYELSEGVTLKQVKKNRDQQFQIGFQRLEFDPIFGLESEVFISRAGLVDLFEIELAEGEQRLVLQVADVMGEINLIEPAP